MKNIVLTGLSGCGKTTVGRAAAERLGLAFFDGDDEIEREAGKSVTAIFKEDGEKFFRAAEAEVIRKLSLKENAVISTGGGAVLNARNAEALKKNGLIVYLKADVSKIAQNLEGDNSRPLLAGDKLSALNRLLNEREELYMSAADCAVDANAPVEAVIERLLVIAQTLT